MNFLVPVMIWGWIPFNIILFRKFSPQKAILISVIGGVIFLPVVSYDLPMINYDKAVSIAVALLCGIIFSGKINELHFTPTKIDMPIFIWCIVSPFLSILTNGLGPYNAFAATIQTSLMWGVYYMAGRIYFSDKEDLRFINRGIILAGIIYIPLTLFEVRMSPQLSIMIYGFFPHDFLQHLRYGGYRPVVFMTSGLMVSLWMAATYTVSLWLYKSGEVTKISKIPMALIVFMLFIVTILCKSANGWVYLILGTLFYFYHIKFKWKMIFKIIIFIIPIYILFRISGILPVETIIDYLSTIFDAHRIESLSVRLFQEGLFGSRAMESPILGWGWIGRAWPIDLFSGANAVSMIDSLYLVTFSIRGFLGLISLYSILLLGPWRILKTANKSIDAVVLSLIILFYTIDTLLNGLFNPIYILVVGALVSFSEKMKDERVTATDELALREKG